MTFTELEVVLFLGNVVLAALYLNVRKEFGTDRYMTAHLLSAIADGDVAVTRKRDGGLSIQPTKKEAV